MSKKEELTPSEHSEIVWLLKSSWSHEAIAKRFSVTIGTVVKIFRSEAPGLFYKKWIKRPITNLT